MLWLQGTPVFSPKRFDRAVSLPNDKVLELASSTDPITIAPLKVIPTTPRKEEFFQKLLDDVTKAPCSLLNLAGLFFQSHWVLFRG